MRRFFLTFWAFYKAYPWCMAKKWTDDDCIELSKVFKGHYPAKLLRNLQAQSIDMDRQATLEKSNREWMAGVASGFRMAIAIIEQSSSVVTPAASDEYVSIPERSGEDRYEQHTR